MRSNRQLLCVKIDQLFMHINNNIVSSTIIVVAFIIIILFLLFFKHLM